MTRTNKQIEDSRDRRHKLQVWLLSEEYDLLIKKADSFNLSISDYVRSLIVWGEVKAQSRLSDEQFQSLLNEMNHIGININQIARRVNEARQASREDFDILEIRYESLLDLFRKWAQY